MPTTFADGPAAGASLMLHRAPVYLRVVIDPAGKVDALDALDDVPAADEAIFVYRWHHAEAGLCRIHLRCARGSKLPSGWYESASYELVPEQPSDEIMRDAAKWRAWCQGMVPNVLQG